MCSTACIVCVSRLPLTTKCLLVMVQGKWRKRPLCKRPALRYSHGTYCCRTAIGARYAGACPSALLRCDLRRSWAPSQWIKGGRCRCRLPRFAILPRRTTKKERMMRRRIEGAPRGPSRRSRQCGASSAADIPPLPLPDSPSFFTLQHRRQSLRRHRHTHIALDEP